MSRVVAMIMAGGKGSRLSPLTCHRAKPAVPFGGHYRIIDFVLSNFLNSGYRQIFVLTQFMATSLIQHLQHNWNLSGLNQFIEIVPAQMRTGTSWYQGTADAVFQNLNLVRDSRADHIAVFGGDHIYLFDIHQMEEFHCDMKADATVSVMPVPSSQASVFGVLAVDDDWRITDFLEKPADPPSIPGRPGWSLASMGNYFFRTDVLQETLIEDSELHDSRHDFGGNILPKLVADGAAVYAYDFTQNRLPNAPVDYVPYWRDVGTIDSYFEANMDLRARLPAINLYNRDWRIRTAQRDYPPARFVRHSADGPPGVADDSLVCEGSIVVGAVLREVLVGYDCVVHHGCNIEESVIISGCDIGSGVRMRKVIMDKNCSVDPGVVIGYDVRSDRERLPFHSDSGIVVLPKGTHVPARGPIQLAYDIEELLRKDPTSKQIMAEFEGRYTVSERDRHSYVAPGPRYDRFVSDPQP